MLALFVIHWNMTDVVQLGIVALILLVILLVVLYCLIVTAVGSVWKKIRRWWSKL